MAGPYVPTGPWTNGGAPGVQASFLTELERWLAQVDNAAATTLAGSSGTATAYMPFQGPHFKKVLIWLNGYQNTSGSTTSLALPTAFTSGLEVRTGSLFQIELRVGSTAQTINVIVGLGSTGGTINAQTNIAARSFGHCSAAIDHIGFRSGGSGPITSIVVLEGI